MVELVNLLIFKNSSINEISFDKSYSNLYLSNFIRVRISLREIGDILLKIRIIKAYV